jgi:hypothetical protein
VVAGLDERRLGLPRERRRHEHGDRRLAQRRRAHGLRQPRGDQVVRRGVVAERPVGPQRRHEQDGEALDPAREERDPAQRGGVGPLQVVDGEHERPAVRQVRQQPVEAVQRRERDVALRRAVGAHGPERLARQGGGAGEQPLAIGLRCGLEDRLEQLAHDPERELALELRRAPEEGPHPGLAGGAQRRPHELRLADPGRPREDEHAPVAIAQPGHRGRERPHLVVALKQVSRR